MTANADIANGVRERRHLPECPPWVALTGSEADCICDRLRACERRVMRHGITRSHGVWHDGYGEGYAAGLDAAREAVDEIRDAIQTHYRIDCEPPGKVDWSQHRKCDPINDALAAIDALREEQP